MTQPLESKTTKAKCRKDIQEVIELVEYMAKTENFPSWVEYAKRAREALDEILVGK